ncbi:MAG: YdbH domain-containing protein [Cellvibrionaceae bacterium]|nr:YdbH domain-containing protein [Cellvibrionaceae bacterium]
MLGKRPLVKALVRVTAVSLVLLVLLYLLIPYYVPAIARIVLAGSGIQIETLQLLRPQGAAVTVPQLQLAMPELGRAHLQHLSLVQGSNQQPMLKIEHARISYTPATDSGRQNAELSQLSELLPIQLLQTLPSGVVNVASLVIDVLGLLSEPMVFTDVEAEHLPDGLQISAKLADAVRYQRTPDAAPEAANAEREPIAVSALLQENGVLELTLQLASAPESAIALKTQVSQQGELLHLQGGISGQAATLNWLIRRFELGKALLADSNIALDIQADIADSPSAAPAWHSVNAALRASGRLAWQDDLALQGPLALNVAMNADGGALRLAQGEPATGRLVWPLEEERRVDIGFGFTPIELNFAGSLDTPAGWSKIRLSEPATVALTMEGQPLANIDLAALALETPAGPLNATLSGNLDASLAQLLVPDGTVSVLEDTISLQAALTFSAEGGTLSLTAPVEATLDIASLTRNDFAPVAVNIPPQTLVIGDSGKRVTDLLLSFRSRYLDPEVDFGGKARVDLDDGVVSVASDIDPMVTEGLRWPGMTVQAEIDSPDANTSEARFSVHNLCGEALLRGTWRDDGREAVTRLRAQRQFSSEDGLRQWFNNETLPLVIKAGHFSLDFQQREALGQPPQTALSARLQDAIGQYPGGKFSGVQITLNTAALSSAEQAQQALRFDLAAQAAELNLGVLASNVLAEAELLVLPEQLSVGLKRVNAELFDGSVTLAPQRFALNETIELLVDIDELDLDQLVATQQVEGLATTGKLSGRIPVTIDGETLSIVGGKVSNLSGGLIQFQSPLADSDDLNAQLKLTLDVLKNFNYDRLDTELDFVEGNLRLKSKLSGKNPDVADGQRVDLNLNTEVDTLSAMAVMRLQAGIEAGVEKFVSREFGDGPLRNICTEKNP